MSKIEQQKIYLNTPKLYKITKLGVATKAKHPESDFGQSAPFHIGYYTGAPIVGENFRLDAYSLFHGEKGILTSTVTRIINDNTFETLNSVYQYEPYNKEI
jgi:hypothetical protein